jgi:hypothetical protein
MTLKEAQNLFEKLKSESTKKSELKIYANFLRILTSLKDRELTKDETSSIELELDNLNLESNPKNKRKHFKKALTKFEKYLETEFSLTSNGYYTNLGIGLGASFGILFGVVFLSSWERSLGISLGLIIGAGIGGAIGKQLDLKAVIEDRVI